MQCRAAWSRKKLGDRKRDAADIIIYGSQSTNTRTYVTMCVTVRAAGVILSSHISSVSYTPKPSIVHFLS
jgi:hypothetical protein